MAEPSGNRGIEYLFSDDGKCSRYVAGFWGDLSDVKDIHGQPLCVGNMVTMLHSGEPYEQMIILKGKIPALTGAPEPSWCGFPAPIYSLKKQRAKLGEGCPARPLRGRAPDCGWKGLFGDSPACSGIGIAFPPGMWYCVAVEAAQYNTD